MHHEHRQAFLGRLEDGDLALIPGAVLTLRNHDVEHPFRQRSDYWYLTGHREPEGALLVAKGIEGLADATLFVLPRDPPREVWSGRRLGPDGAREQLGFADAASIAELPARLAAALPRCRRLWFRLGESVAFDEMVIGALRGARHKTRQGIHAPGFLVDPGPALHHLRLRKSEAELRWMRRSAAVTAEAHQLAMAQAAPGVGEWEIEALLGYTFRRHGADGWAYPSIVAGGANACILHYTTNDRWLAAGELVLVDAGAEFRGYAADVTRTFPVAGAFTPLQRRVYEIVLAAERAGIEECVPGAPCAGVHEAAVRVLAAGLIELGVLAQPLAQVLDQQLYKPWYMHNTSHWLGLDVHDAGDYTAGADPRPLEEGMCLTVEPGLYFPPDDERVPAELRGLGVRLEDDVLITAGGHELLTLATPKEVADVEAACAAARAMPPCLDTELIGS